MTFLAAVLLAATVAHPAPQPKNIILLIADGAGLAQFTVAKNVRGEQFRIGTMPVIGLVTTPCLDRNVTDSAAAATTYATGYKTNYEMLSQLPDGTKPPTVVEEAIRRGKATGLVTTADFWDATPAAFAAHANHRRDPGIEDQMIRTGVNVIAGTGIQKFGKEGRPPFDDWAAKTGYTVITKREQLEAAKGPKLLAVFTGQDRDLEDPQAPLPVLAQWAIDHLDDDPDGFFVMIEMEGTDGSSHQNQTPDLRRALDSFDQAVGVALDFASKRTDTLVVVAADHETGGARISETAMRRFRVEYSTTDHTATMVPIFAYGPGSQVFAGIQDNTDVGKKLMGFVTAPR